MADWKRIIVGDAFKLPNKSPRYYVDVALVPVAIYSLLIGIIAIWSWPPATWNRVDALWAAVAMLLCLVAGQGANDCIRRRNGLLLFSRPQVADSLVDRWFASELEMGTSSGFAGSHICGGRRPVGAWILAKSCDPQRREPGALRLCASLRRQADRLGCSTHRCITGRAWTAPRLALLLSL